MTTRLIGLIVLALAGVACSDDPGSGGAYAGQPSDGYGSYGGGGEYGSGTSAAISTSPSTDPCAGSIPAYEDVAAFDKCVTCHDSAKGMGQRHNAPIAVNFDTEAAAERSALAAVGMVKAGSMPPAPSGLTLSAAEKQQLYTWAMCSM
jgi:hypothetical protein